jgi:hypothetical protein
VHLFLRSIDLFLRREAFPSISSKVCCIEKVARPVNS